MTLTIPSITHRLPSSKINLLSPVKTIVASILFFVLGGLTTFGSDIPLVPIHDSKTISSSPWTPFNSAPFDADKLITYGNYQYTIYWGSDEHLYVGRRNLSTNEAQTVQLSDRLPNNDVKAADGHHNTVIGISPDDGRLHLAFKHWGTSLNYKRSVAGFITNPPAQISASHFGNLEAMTGVREGRVTYPRFFNDNNEKLFFVYRDYGSGSGESRLKQYDHHSGGSWSDVGKITDRDQTYQPLSSGSRNAYIDDILFDAQNRLHMTWTWRELAETYNSNHDLNYAYSDDGGDTWYDNAGTPVAKLSEGNSILINEDPGILVANIPPGTWNINQCGMALDSKNQPHVIRRHMPVEQADISRVDETIESPNNAEKAAIRFFHYYRGTDDDKTWHRSAPLPAPVGTQVNKRPKILIDPSDNVIFYWPTPVEGKGVFAYVASPQDNWTTWKLIQLTGPQWNAKDGTVYDRRRWESEQILSIYLDGKSNQSGSDYSIVDFRLEDILAAAGLSDSGNGVTPPVANGNLADRVYTQDAVLSATVDASVDFDGTVDSWQVSATGGLGVTINANGVVYIALDAIVTGATVTVTASNAGGSTQSSFQVSVQEDHAEPADFPLVDDMTSGNHWLSGDNPGGAIAVDPADLANSVYVLADTSSNAKAAALAILEIPNGTTATLFFRVRSTAADPNFVWGASDVNPPSIPADFNGTNFFNQFEGYGRLIGSGFQVRDGGSFKSAFPAAPDTWYNVWLVLDNTANEATLYVTTGSENATGVDGVTGSFRNGTSSSLTHLLVYANDDGDSYLDDVHVDLSGVNLGLPSGDSPVEPADFPLVDDMDSGDHWIQDSNPGGTIADDPTNPANKVYSLTDTDLTAKAAALLIPEIPNGTTATLFFRVRSNAADPDFVWGASDANPPSIPADFSGTNFFNQFEGYGRLIDSGFQVRDGGSFKSAFPAAPDTWYNVWLVLDNAVNETTLYVTTGLENATAVDGVTGSFRNGTSSSLTHLLVYANDDGDSLIDDVHIDLTGANLGLPFAIEESGFLMIEAEHADNLAQPEFSPLAVIDDSTASEGKFITVASGSSQYGGVPNDGRATYAFTLDEAGPVYVWMRTIAPNTSSDSFWVGMDDSDWANFNLITPSSTWLWNRVHNYDGGAPQAISWDLGAGEHYLVVAYRETGTKLDRIVITQDPAAVPDE